MENPLKLNHNLQKQNVNLGRDSRKQNREIREKIIINTGLNIVYFRIPEMFEKVPNTDRFEEMWPIIDKALRKAFKNKQDYHFVYNHICSLLEQGNRIGLWHIEVPEPFIEIKKAKSTRPLKWHKNAAKIAKYPQQIFDISPATLSIQEAFAQILLSMIFHGGLNRSDLWASIGVSLKQHKPFHGDKHLLYLRLLLPFNNNKIPTNERYYCEDEKDFLFKTTYDYFPDPISLGLIEQFLSRQHQDWEPAKSSKECLTLINDSFNLNLKFSELCKGGIAYAEKINGIHLPQALLEVTLGNHISSSLPQDYWNRFHFLNLKELTHNSFRHFVYNKSQSIPCKNNPHNIEHPYFYEKLRDIFSWPSNKIKKTKDIIIELLNIDEHELSQHQYILLQWLVNLLKNRKNKALTAKRYFQAIALKWIIATRKIDLSQLNCEEYYSLYQEILNEIDSIKERHYCAGRLNDLHRFCVINYQFPTLPRTISTGTKEQPHVCAAFIDEPLFSALLKQFNLFSDLSAFEKQMYRCILIIAYRTGLRPSEIVKLRIKDVQPSEEMWLFIQENQFGTNKTSSATRKVPLMPLLTSEEKNIVKKYIHERQLTTNNSTSLFFCLPAMEYIPIDFSTLSRATSQILSYLTGGLYYRFYHLRHSALSRLQLLIHSQEIAYPEIIDKLIPYGTEQRQEILHLIFGKNRKRDRYLILAYFAGHRTPSTTFHNYLHFSQLIIGLIFQKNKMQLTDKQAKNLFGLSTFQLRKYKKSHNKIIVKDIVKKTKSKLNQVTQVISPIIKHQTLVKYKTADYKQEIHVADEFHIAIKILNKIQSGNDYDDIAWFYDVTENKILQWLQSAKALKKIITINKKPRLFSHQRLDQLLPPSLQDQYVKQDIKLALTKYQIHFSSATRDSDLAWLIQYTLTHCTTSRSGISFEDSTDFQCFMKIATRFFPSTRWRLHLNLHDEKIIKNWKYQSVEIQTNKKKQKARSINGSGWLLLKHKNENVKMNENNKKYSSYSFRYFMHILAIILFTEDEINQWQDKIKVKAP